MREQRSMAIYTFGEALQYLKIGHKASRSEWGDNIFVFYDNEKNTMFKKINNIWSPWEVPQGDLLAEDWVVIKSV